MLNTQADLRQRLAAFLDVPVKIDVPADRPEAFVVVTREGGHRKNALLDVCGMGIYCYAPTEQKAWELADKVADFIDKLPFAEGYASVEQEAMYRDPDPNSRSPRWYLSYTLTTYEPSAS